MRSPVSRPITAEGTLGRGLKILFLEDVATDAELEEMELRRAGIRFVPYRVQTEEDFIGALGNIGPDVILADYKLPAFDGLAALKIAKETCPDIPFIFVTGAMGEERAIETFKKGATDYVLKDRISKLGPAVSRAIKEAGERKRAEEEKRKLEDQLRQAQKMEAVGQLAGGIAHDFNNVISAVMGFATLVHMKMRAEDPLRQYVEQILESTERAGNLTHGLLAFSRTQIMNPKPVNLNGIIRCIEKLLSRLISEDIEIKTILREDDPYVMADTGQIEQVLMNLATNARDAMPKGGLLLIGTDLVAFDESYVKAHGYGKPGTHAVLSVTDTGTGMDEETRKKIFEPFFTTKEVGKGTGLGLAMVYGIIRQHHGYIDVCSEPCKGTTFKLYLPAIGNKAGKEKAISAPSPLIKGSETILAAEDNPAFRRLMEIVLREYGYDVIMAEDGEEAVRKFRENREKIALCILDIIMPKKSGREVYEEVKMMRADIKVFFVSGYTADKILKERILEEGLDFIIKPVSPRDLLVKVREMLDRRT